MIGSFESWATTIGGILQHAGIDGFLTNLDEMHQQSDDDGPQWEAFFRQLWASMGTRRFTTGEAVRWIEDRSNTLARDVLPDQLAGDVSVADDKVDLSTGFSRKLGKAFVRQARKRFGGDGLRLERAGDDTHEKVARWFIAVG